MATQKNRHDKITKWLKAMNYLRKTNEKNKKMSSRNGGIHDNV